MNTIKVGSKPIGNYLMAILIEAQRGNKEIYLEAYGRNLSKMLYMTQLLEGIGGRVASITPSKRQYTNKEGKSMTLDGQIVKLVFESKQ